MTIIINFLNILILFCTSNIHINVLAQSHPETLNQNFRVLQTENLDNNIRQVFDATARLIGNLSSLSYDQPFPETMKSIATIFSDVFSSPTSQILTQETIDETKSTSNTPYPFNTLAHTTHLASAGLKTLAESMNTLPDLIKKLKNDNRAKTSTLAPDNLTVENDQSTETEEIKNLKIHNDLDNNTTDSKEDEKNDDLKITETNSKTDNPDLNLSSHTDNALNEDLIDTVENLDLDDPRFEEKLLARSYDDLGSQDETDPNAEHCLWRNFKLYSGTLRPLTNISTVNKCRYLCSTHKACYAFSYHMVYSECYLLPTAQNLIHNVNFVSGLVTCHEGYKKDFLQLKPMRKIKELKYNVQPQQFRYHSQDLIDNSRIDYTLPSQTRQLLPADSHTQESDCWDYNVGFDGDQLNTIENIKNLPTCQQMCLSQSQCAFFSYIQEIHRCILYRNANLIKDSSGVISGTKDCVISDSKYNFPAKANQQQASASEFGNAIDPNKLLSLLYQTDSNSPNDVSNQINNLDNNLPINDADTQNLFNTRKEEVNYNLTPIEKNNNFLSNILSGGIFKNIFASVPKSQLIEAQSGENIFNSATRAVESLGTFFSATNTVMKTIPFNEIVEFSKEIANSKLLKRDDSVRGGVQPTAQSKADASQPPTGVSEPEVTCLSKGMKCCVPRNAAPRYQTEPPLLNGIDTPRCRATYSSSTDQLCVTARYEDAECQTLVAETDNLLIYRNIMEMPGRDMNNAICECTVEKNANDSEDNFQTRMASGAMGKGKWQYSLAVQEEEQAQKKRNQDAMTNLDTGVKWFRKVTDAYVGNLKENGMESNAQNVGTVANLMNTVVDVGSELKTLLQTAKKPSNARLLSTVERLSSHAEKYSERKLQSPPASGHYYAKPLRCVMKQDNCHENECVEIVIIDDQCPQSDSQITIDWSLTYNNPNTPPTLHMSLPQMVSVSPMQLSCEFIYEPRPQNAMFEILKCPKNYDPTNPDNSINLSQSALSAKQFNDFSIFDSLLDLKPDNLFVDMINYIMSDVENNTEFLKYLYSPISDDLSNEKNEELSDLDIENSTERVYEFDDNTDQFEIDYLRGASKTLKQQIARRLDGDLFEILKPANENNLKKAGQILDKKPFKSVELKLTLPEIFGIRPYALNRLFVSYLINWVPSDSVQNESHIIGNATLVRLVSLPLLLDGFFSQQNEKLELANN